MQLGRYSVSTLRASPIHSIHFSQDGAFFSVASETGYEVWRSYPLGLVRRRELGGTLAVALPLPYSPLLVLQGGGNDPLYSPNKAIIYHDELGIAVAQLEFSERIRGVTCRHGTLCIALSHRVIAFQYGIGAGNSRPGDAGPSNHMDDRGRFSLRKLGQWETSENEQGLMALSTMPGSTLLALPGRQAGHVQLIQLPPCPSPKSASASSPGPSNKSQGFRSPIILAHTHPLSTLTCTPSGSHIITTSERGTLLRVWDTARGQLQRELRRGVDRAEMWGARFEPLNGAVGGKGGRVVGWSDKGTMHIWDDETKPLRDGSTSTSTTTPPSLTNLLSRNIALPKYFSSTASVAQYHLPRKNPHAFASVVGAAAGKAGMTTKSSSEDVDGDGEWSERFVVGWIRVELGADASGGLGEKDGGNRHGKTSVDFTTARGGAHLGSREERRSFGSETPSSRTATPTPFSKGAFIPSRTETPPTPRAQRSSAASTVSAGGAGTSANMHSTSTIRSTRPTSSNPTGSGAKGEMQLVAITYSGDWYRLRIPQDDEAGQRGKCELVEYRRLGVGGGGW